MWRNSKRIINHHEMFNASARGMSTFHTSERLCNHKGVRGTNAAQLCEGPFHREYTVFARVTGETAHRNTDTNARRKITLAVMELSLSWEGASWAVTRELYDILWNPKVHYRVHKSNSVILILSHINPVHTTLVIFKIHFNIINPRLHLSSHLFLSSAISFLVLWYKPECRGFETRWCEWISWIYLILLAALGNGVRSTSNRNEYQKHKNKNVCGE
jgi:hypothetical protein